MEGPRVCLLLKPNLVSDFVRKCNLHPPDPLSQPASVLHSNGGGREQGWKVCGELPG